MDPADKLRVGEAGGFDDVGLRHDARDADMLVAVGGQDVGPSALEVAGRGEGRGREVGEEGNVAEEELVGEGEGKGLGGFSGGVFRVWGHGLVGMGFFRGGWV